MASQSEGPSSSRFHQTHRFWVQIDGVNVAGFMECSALVISTEVKEVSEGGVNTYTHKLPGRTKYQNITLKHGVDDGLDLYRWYQKVLAEPKTGGPSYRRNISIVMYDPLGSEVRRWNLHDAYPVKWSGPDLKAQDASPAVETLELAHSGLVAD